MRRRDHHARAHNLQRREAPRLGLGSHQHIICTTSRDVELTLCKCGFTILSVAWLMTFKRGHRTIVFQYWLVALEWLNWGLMSTTLKGYAFTISGQGACISKDNGSHLMTPECNAVYASLAFSAVETILCSISVAFVVCVVQVDRNQKKQLSRIESDGVEQ